ncbi:MAG: hypothetical protein WCQ44_07460, partial [Opitutaceae bacterium]
MATISHSPSRPEDRLVSRQDAETILRIALERAQGVEDGLSLKSVFDIGSELGVPREVLEAVALEQQRGDQLRLSIVTTALRGSLQGVISELDSEEVKGLTWRLKEELESPEFRSSLVLGTAGGSLFGDPVLSRTLVAVELRSESRRVAFEVKVVPTRFRTLVAVAAIGGGLVGLLCASLLGWSSFSIEQGMVPFFWPMVALGVIQSPGAVALGGAGGLGLGIL